MKKAFLLIHDWAKLCIALFRGSVAFRILALLIIGTGTTICLVSYFNRTETIPLNFAGDTCKNSYILLPSLGKVAQSGFDIKYTNYLDIFGTHLFAGRVCFKPNKIPSENSSVVLPRTVINRWIITKKYILTINRFPKLNADLSKLQSLPTTEPIAFKLSQPDVLFSYVLHADGKSTNCEKTNAVDINCNPKTLELKHGTAYEFALERRFGDEPVETLSTAEITTVQPINIVQSSIPNGTIVYDKPSSITLTVDKMLKSSDSARLMANGVTQELKTSLQDKTLLISFARELERGVVYTLIISDVKASDGGTLTMPYTLNFTTSKGPRVSRANIGTSGVDYNQDVILFFDQILDSNSANMGEISLIVDGKAVQFSGKVAGNSLVINPNNPFGKCSTISINVGSGVKNPAGIFGESKWSLQSRANCYDTISIGKSVQGRSIVGYKFGSGSSSVLYVGGIHGDEKNAKHILEKWIIELNANPGKIPANRSIVVIPSANPDGYAKSSRTNVNGINLNRNFPANNWKQSIKEPSGNLLPSGGGSAPLSEPEALALANYTTQLHPQMVMSYHSAAAIVVGNDAGNSRNLAALYAAKSQYIYKTNDTIGNTFDYDTTGAYEDWLSDKPGIPGILIELKSKNEDEFLRNKTAMWLIAQSTSF